MRGWIRACFFGFFLIRPLTAEELPDSPKPKILLVAQGGLSVSDAAYTESFWAPGAKEFDPLARPVMEHKGLAVSLAVVETAGCYWLGQRMRRSERFHRIWWVPQTAGILGHAYALSRTLERNHGN